MTTPVLYIFAISHYCEKARWALDYLNIEYRLQHISPITHVKFVRGLGVADTSLPVLTAGSLSVQGSSRIIDWAEAQGRPGKNSQRKRSLEVDTIAEVSSAWMTCPVFTCGAFTTQMHCSTSLGKYDRSLARI